MKFELVFKKIQKKTAKARRTTDQEIILRKLGILELRETKIFEPIAIDEEMEKKLFNCAQSERFIRERS